MELTGGCVCGAVRFRVTAEPLVAYFCHCTMCQKRSGAPVSAGGTFPMEAFAFTKGKPKIIESLPGFVRQICGKCGSILGMRAKENPKLASVRLGCLDDPSSVTPEFHIFTSSQVSWCEIADDLPRYPESAPEVDRLWTELDDWQPAD